MSWNLLWVAAAIAVTHTALGPDHTLPFLMLARARGWSSTRTLAVALACGAGHVGSSLLLGGIGLVLGYGVGRLEGFEGARGDLASWALVGFGLAYGVWGVRKAVERGSGLVPHEHHGLVHLHAQGNRHHVHAGEHGRAATFWMLFAVFVLGPCEPLIPLFVLPASRGLWGIAALTAAVFTAFTLATMLTVVAAGRAGIERLPLARLGRWTHALAGGVVAASGLAVVLLGL